MSEITEIKTLNGYPLADTKAREDIATLTKEMTGLQTSVDNFFADAAGTSANILPPDSEAGYFDLETGEPLTSSNHVRTPAPIPLESGKTNLYIISNITSTTDNVNAVVHWLDASGNFLSYKNISRSAMQGKSSVGAIPGNATQFHVWLKGSSLGYTLANLCISYEELPAYEAYVAGGAKVIKAESLDPAALKTFAPLYKKKIVNFGDSIYGKRRPPEDISTELAAVTGAIVYNCGFGGCRMAQHSIEQYDAFSMYRLAYSIANNDWTLQDAAIAQETWDGGKPSYFAEVLTMLKGIDFNEVDIVTIAYGTNDFTGNIVLENAENAQDTASFAGALRYSIETLLTAYPHLKIFVCSQVWRFWMDSNNVYTEDSDTHTNSHGAKLPEFVDKTEALSKEYHLPYIDTYYSTGFNKFNRGMYFSGTDGTHPLTTGLHVIAHVVARSLY